MILILIAGAVVLLCSLVICYLFLFSKPFSFSKTIKDDSASLIFSTRRDIQRVLLSCGSGKCEIKFERRNIRNGETIEFVYPLSLEKAKLVVEMGPEGVKTFDI